MACDDGFFEVKMPRKSSSGVSLEIPKTMVLRMVWKPFT